MSSKLVSSLGYRFKRVVKCFHEVSLDSLYRVHLVISNSEFLDDDQKYLIQLHTRALLVHNRKCNEEKSKVFKDFDNGWLNKILKYSYANTCGDRGDERYYYTIINYTHAEF